MKTYSIQMTAILSGVSPDCIRAWERRYGAIVPDRDKGRRIFYEGDVTRLVMLKELSLVGNPISSVAKLSDPELLNLCRELGLNLSSKKTELQAQKNPNEILALAMLALRNKRFDVLVHELTKACDDLSCKDYSMNLMSPVLDDFFKLSFTPVEKKVLSGVFKSLMLRKMSQESGTEKNAAIFYQAEANELKSYLSAMLLAQNGFKITSIEQCLDFEVIVESSRMLNAAVTVIEMTPQHHSELNSYSDRLQSLGIKGDLILNEQGYSISLAQGLSALEQKVQNL